MSDQICVTRSTQDKLAIANRIKRHMHSIGMSRKELSPEDSPGPRLSMSTINKALAGDFSEATLAKIESILKTRFATEEERQSEAAADLGGYTLRTVQELIGEYFFVRPSFSNPSRLIGYLVEILWDEKQACLVFNETFRPDPTYQQRGNVYIPFGRPFLTLVTMYNGMIRTVMVSQPDGAGVLRGIICTLHNAQSTYFLPATAPVILKKLKSVAGQKFGYIEPQDDAYSDLKAMLDSVTHEKYAAIITGTPDWRKGLSLVS
jgi:hypothetical protein